MVAKNKYFEHFILKCQVLLGFEITDIMFWMSKRAFQVYLTADISKTVCLAINVFPSMQSLYKGLSAKEIWKTGTAKCLRKWICKMLYVALFCFCFRFLGGQKMTFPFLDFSRFFVCPSYALKVSHNIEKVNVAICSHIFLDWLAYILCKLIYLFSGSGDLLFSRVIPRPSLFVYTFDFSSKTIERNSTKLVYQVCVFSRPIRKKKLAAWPLICWDIVYFSSETANEIQWNLTGSKTSTTSTK